MVTPAMSVMGDDVPVSLLTDDATVPQGVVDQVNALLAKVKAGWKLG